MNSVVTFLVAFDRAYQLSYYRGHLRPGKLTAANERYMTGDILEAASFQILGGGDQVWV